MSDHKYTKYTLSDNALAHIALAETQIHSSNDLGKKTSIDELVKLSQGRLNKQRKEEVLAQLQSDEKLYRIWMALPAEFSSDTAKSAVPENGKYPQAFVSKLKSLIDSFFSWHSLAPLAFGLLLGLSFTLDMFDQKDPINNAEVAILNQPLNAPQKATLGTLNENIGPNEIIDIASNNNWIAVIYRKNGKAVLKIFGVTHNDDDVSFNIYNQFVIDENDYSDMEITSFDGSLLTYSVGKEKREIDLKK